jgi:hypothetical protein
MTLPGYEPYPTAAPPRGIGVAALMLGILAIPTLPLCLLGMVVAPVGLVVGVIALAKGNGRAFAAVGVALSVLALVLGTATVTWLLSTAHECADTAKYPDDPAREQCIERKFPFIDSPRSLDHAAR